MDRPSRHANGRGRSCRIGIMLAMGAVWLLSCADDPDPIEPQNRPPVVLQEMPDLYLEDGTADTVNVWEYFLDPDGDALSYTAVSADPGVATVAVDGTALVVLGVAQGWVVITVTATDSGGLEASTDLFVEVKGHDWRILVELYEATGGPTWRIQANWLTDEPLNHWYGVFVDSAGRVGHLSLGYNGLKGTIPPSFGELPGLWALDLEGNELSGPIPSALFGLSSLNRLNLSRNEFDGSIPEGIGGLSGLRSLRLAGNRLTGAIPPQLGDLAWLESLDLGDNRLTGPIPAQLGDLGRIAALVLSGNQLSGAIPPELGNPASLVRLDLRNNRLTGSIPAGLGGAGGLASLNLSDNELTGAIPPELGGLGRLADLDLTGNELTGPIPPELGDLGRLADLDLSDNNLTGPVPGELGGLTFLESLDLGDNNLTGPIPGELGGLSFLQALDLSGNDLRGPIPGELGGLRSVRVLQLSRNSLTDPIPSPLGDLYSLEELHLRDNDLTGPLPPEMGDLRRLANLDLRRNPRLSGEIPLDWTSLAGLETFATHETGLCAPADPVLQDWLDGVLNQHLASCGSWAAYLTQAVQSREYPVPLVAGGDALLRVFPTALRETEDGLPPVRATFYLGGAEVHRVEIAGKSTPVPTTIDEGSLEASANADVPGSVVQPGLEMVIEIDPEGTLDPALGVTRRIPEDGRLPVRVATIPNLDFTLIPFLWSEDPDSAVLGLVAEMAENPESHEMFSLMRTVLPVSTITVSVHDPVWTSTNVASELFFETVAIRVGEQGSPVAGLSRYVGMMSGPVEGAAGAVYDYGRVAFAIPNDTAFAQTVGALTSLTFAPCDEEHPDPYYPIADGSIGSWGYDARIGDLVSPATPDLMSSCGLPRWISAYHFSKAVRFRLSFAGARVGEAWISTRDGPGGSGTGNPGADRSRIILRDPAAERIR